MTVSVEVVSSVDQLPGIKSGWQQLEKRISSTRYYQRFSYFAAYCNQLSDSDVTPNVLVFSQQQEIVAVFPWVRRRNRIFGWGYWDIGTPEHDHIHLNDILLLPAATAAVTQAFADYRRSLPINTVITVKGVAKTSSYQQLISAKPLIPNYWREITASYFIDFTESPADKKLPKRMVKNVKRLLRKAEDTGEVKFEFLCGDAITDRAFSDFLQIESSGWKGSAGTGTAIALHQELRDYYGELLRAMPENMQISLYYLDGQVIAAHYCFKDAHCLSLAKVGYSEEQKPLSPSHVLIYKAICQAVDEQGLSKVSFVTDAGWLEKWEPQAEPIYCVYVPACTLSSIAISLAFYIRTQVKRVRLRKAGT